MHIVPSSFLFIGLLNAGPEFEAQFVDFHTGLASVFVATLFVYVASFHLHLCVFRLYCGFVTKFLPCLQCLSFVRFFATKFMNVAT